MPNKENVMLRYFAVFFKNVDCCT